MQKTTLAALGAALAHDYQVADLAIGRLRTQADDRMLHALAKGAFAR